ncbi:MAG TPA: hypothetical protein VLC98_04170 [Phnomibacter sp.]|nr:hypothetical protein [Phnomibacter sp.]
MVITKLLRFFWMGSLGLVMGISADAQDVSTDPPKKLKSTRKAEKREKVNQLAKAEEEGAIVYNKQWVMGGKLYNDGGAVFYEWAKKKTPYLGNFYIVELGTRKAENQYKINYDDMGGFGRPYIYAKQNVFLTTKFGFGQQYIIGGKANKNGVAVMAVYGGGLSLGLLKPYYIKKTDPLTNQEVTIKWQGDESRNDTLFLDQGSISTSAGFFKGFNEVKIKPGLFAKTGLRFDYGRYNELVSAIECGINVEYYFGEMPMMVHNEPKSFFANVYVGFEFGRRK